MERSVRCVIVVIALLLVQSFAPMASADDQPGSSVEDIRKLKQNPVSGLRSVFLQNTVGTTNGDPIDVFSVQPVWPFRLGADWKLITYTIVPFVHLPPIRGNDSVDGLGNILFNGYFAPEKSDGPITWGIGPAVDLPTRTDSALGSNRVSLGPAALVYGVAGPFSAGLVLQNIWSVGGHGANRVNALGAQYIFNYNLPKGWYLESNSTIEADWTASDSDRWTVPVGAGFGRVFQIPWSKLFYSASIQGFDNVVRPDGAPVWTVIAQLQIIISQ